MDEGMGLVESPCFAVLRNQAFIFSSFMANTWNGKFVSWGILICNGKRSILCDFIFKLKN